MHTDTYRFFQNHGISRKTTSPKKKKKLRSILLSCTIRRFGLKILSVLILAHAL